MTPASGPLIPGLTPQQDLARKLTLLLDVVVAESRRARANEREVLGSLAASPAEPRCLEAEARGA